MKGFLCPLWEGEEFRGYSFCTKCARFGRRIKAIHPEDLPVFCGKCAGEGIKTTCPYCGDEHTLKKCGIVIRLLRIKLGVVLQKSGRQKVTILGKVRKW